MDLAKCHALVLALTAACGSVIQPDDTDVSPDDPPTEQPTGPLTLATIPRMGALASCSTVCPMCLSPSALIVAFWRLLKPIALLT